MKRGAVLICLFLASCGDVPERLALEPLKISFDPPPLAALVLEELEVFEDPVELSAGFSGGLPDFDPIGANIQPLDVTIPIRVVRRRVRGRMRVFRTFPIPPESVTDDPGLTLSRITASEEGWTSRDGMGAIVQIARNVQARTCDPERHTDCVEGRESILSALRRLSSRLTGQRNPTTRRGLWTSSLPVGDVVEPPPYWRECPRGSEGARMRRAHECEGTWSAYREHWNDRQAEAAGWISRPRRRGPCRGRPMAWGCPDCGDDVAMMRRNQTRVSRGFRAFERLECGDVHNSIWGIPPDDVAPGPEPPREDLGEVPEILEVDT